MTKYFDEVNVFHDFDELPTFNEDQPEQQKRVVLASCPEPCQVCGGKSTGYHYEVSSCNGCKSFFRRIIVEKRVLHCAFKNNCMQSGARSTINQKKLPKRKCRACRFNKCVEVGMNPNAINTDRMQENIFVQSKRTDQSSQVLLKMIIAPENRAAFSLGDLVYSEHKLQQLRKSSYNFRPDCGLTVDSLLDTFTPMGSLLPEMPPLVNWKMTPMFIEYHLMNNFFPLPYIDFSQFPPNYKFWFYMDIVYQISWISSFDFFKTIERTDQSRIVRIVTVQLSLLTTSFFSYINKSSTCIFPDGMHFVLRNSDMFDVIRNCYEMKLEQEEYVLLKILLICNPTWDKLSPPTRAVLSTMQRKFTNILLDYCMRKHGLANAPARMMTLIELQNTVIHKAAKVRSQIELVGILRLRRSREILIDQVCYDIEKR